MIQKVIISKNEQQTAELATQLAKLSQRGDVWALYGTLGMGKSVFARAFIQSLCEAEEVPSPTFTLVQTYTTPQFEIYHYDLYRLKSPEEIFELGVEEAFYDGVCLVEWPEKMAAYAPRNMWKVAIEAIAEGRKITISASDENKIQRLSQWLSEN